MESIISTYLAIRSSDEATGKDGVTKEERRKGTKEGKIGTKGIDNDTVATRCNQQG